MQPYNLELLSWTTIDARSNVASSSLVFLLQEAATDTQRHHFFFAEWMFGEETFQCAPVSSIDQ